MQPEDQFILDFIPILRKYLSHRKIKNLDLQLNLLEEQLNEIKTNKSNNTTEKAFNDEENSKDEEGETNEEDKLLVDITLTDLQNDVQEYIFQSLGFKSMDELWEKRPELDGPVFTLTI